ncbi:release factor glutamine methyltransferase [Actinobaculum suis]|uniref:Peptide chain release factor N(5)-glutamine methyltransferase n=1 Tax=Actinobaculum suis TaxID=1657 RepID=A0A1G7CEH8_9ACTO|nr:peptide chain release factor N(5)-glutamine methyltransferase [Actinobaculum suis]MDY5152987.1 peptide chain release factor N(5)-glutamine methyltransferase [Actinobaculum suis]SDE37784.1 release factor glutamine methyltransferase [Actinobaculum suis]
MKQGEANAGAVPANGLAGAGGDASTGSGTDANIGTDASIRPSTAARTPASTARPGMDPVASYAGGVWASLLRDATYLLAESGVASPGHDARELAEFVLGERPWPSRRIASTAEARRYLELVAQRAARIPLQHLTGRMYFRYLTLKSTPDALIVRPETELVAGEAIDFLRELVAAGNPAQLGGAPAAGAAPAPLAVDLGTGSGAIALAIATEVPTARVVAVDISAAALALAAENARHYQVPTARLEFRQGDAMAPPASAASVVADLRGRCDVVVTNPPYVPPQIFYSHSPEVQADPELALAGGGPHGLEKPEAFLASAVELLRPGGLVVMEHAEEQAAPLREAARRAGLTQVGTGNDLTGRPRWLRGYKPV